MRQVCNVKGLCCTGTVWSAGQKGTTLQTDSQTGSVHVATCCAKRSAIACHIVLDAGESNMTSFCIKFMLYGRPHQPDRSRSDGGTHNAATCFEDPEASVLVGQLLLRVSLTFSRCPQQRAHGSAGAAVLGATDHAPAHRHTTRGGRVVPQLRASVSRRRRSAAAAPPEREQAEAHSLLDRLGPLLVDFLFPWSSTVNDRNDT